MKEQEIWRDCYNLAMRETDESDKLFTKELLQCVADKMVRNIDTKRVKSIFVDCYNMLQGNLEKPNWIAINEYNEKLIHGKYKENEQEQLFCAELIAVVVNHLDRRTGNGTKAV